MNPIYIYAPAFVNWSAGIKVLYLLCQELNRIGAPAWIALHGPTSENMEYPVPVLNQEIIDQHAKNKFKIIAIYTESVLGNPLNAAFTVRWILNYPGLLGGQKIFKDDFLLAYSQNLTTASKNSNPSSSIEVLFIPALNMQEMLEARKAARTNSEKYSLIYAQKFRSLGGKINPVQQKTIEITRVEKSSTKRQQTLNLIAGAEQVYVYENTTVITEAQILGTPVRCISNKWFNQLIAEAELGTSGIVWGIDAQLEQPNSEHVIEKVAEFEKNLPKKLFELTNRWFSSAEEKAFKKPKLPSNSLISKHSVMRMKALMQTKSILSVAKFGWTYLKRWKNNHGN
jgi:hypothetical protein